MQRHKKADAIDEWDTAMTQKNSTLSTMNRPLFYAIGYLVIPIIVNAFQQHRLAVTGRSSYSPLARQYFRHWSQQQQPRRLFSPLSVANLRDADLTEMMIGGIRYEMVPLPDSMMDTTIFVGNLNEFVHVSFYCLEYFVVVAMAKKDQ